MPHTIFYRGKDGIDPISRAQVPHTKIDFQSCLWSFDNCERTIDHPYTVRTRHLGTETFMYAMLKLTPGMYVCTVKCNDGAPNCRLEIIQREKDYDDDDSNNGKNTIVHRHGCLCAHTTDLRMLISADTDAEIRIVFDPFQDIRVPSFRVMEVRSRRKIPLPMKRTVPTGLYKPTPMRYGALDIHRMLKKVHYTIHWLKTMDIQLNAVLRLVSNPLWDIDDPTNAFDYTQTMQLIQNALSIELPRAFVATSYCFSVFLFPGVKVPLLSQTLVKELVACINADPINTNTLIRVFRHSLKYINFMVVEYVEFKQLVSDKLVGLTGSGGRESREWGVVRVEM